MNDIAPPKISRLHTALCVFISPNEAFKAIERRPLKLFPMMMIWAAFIAMFIWYFSIVELDSIIGYSLSGPDLTAQDRAEAEALMESITRYTQAFGAAIGLSASSLILWALYAAYLSLISAMVGDKVYFGQWFSLIVWTSLVMLVRVAAGMVVLYNSPDGRLSVEALNPLVLSNLGMESGNGWLQGFYDYVDITAIWQTILVILAYRRWLAASWFRAIAVVTGPYWIIGGALALIYLFFWAAISSSLEPFMPSP